MHAYPHPSSTCGRGDKSDQLLTSQPFLISVAVDTPQHSGLQGTLHYSSDIAVVAGSLVKVPLGRRQVCGVVWPGQVDSGDSGEGGFVTKPVTEVLLALPALTPRWCALVEFAAGYYQRSLGEMALSVLPPELRKLSNAQLQSRLLRLRKSWGNFEALAPTPKPILNSEQLQVLAQLQERNQPGAAPVVVLHGLTGSGKTEVYLHAAEQALARGQQVLVLVPEINLTPQLEARFAERFCCGETPHRMVSLHSSLTPAQRLKNWLAAHLGWADVVLGTRLAVFTPMPRLGLIVVDEEHDPSYKQQDGARYSARDLAVYRGKLESACVVLGSATPSLESWHHANRGRYVRLTLAQRVGGGPLPQVRLVDMSLLPKLKGVNASLAAPLVAALAQRIECGEQSLVFLNRRGYAPVLHCTACAWKSACPHCSAWRVFHKLERSLRCHHCGFSQPVPKSCPDCGNPDIAPVGQGTERLEEQLAALLPGVRMARIDADTTKHKGALEARLASVHAGEVDILVGTQMVTKGHDFRRMTLVAAVNPDGALFSSDFRAPERLFSLLMQAAGRAGRSAEQALRSEMWVQTWFPTHPLYAALRQHDYHAFASSQLDERRVASLPPFSYLGLLRAEAKTAQAALGFLQAAAQLAATLPGAEQVLLYPAVPTSVARVANVERMQMLVESSSRLVLQRLLTPWMAMLPALRSQHRQVLRWALDVDPLGI
jgi:primosomal protein N' (replication factor Y) (superfamily II helicase)